MKESLQAAMKEAMKAKDKIRLDTIRGVISAIQYEEIQTKTEPLAPDGCLAVLQREVKKRKEEVEFAEKAARSDLLEKLRVEISVLESFLPAQLDSSRLEKIIIDLKSENPSLNVGLAMKALKEKYAGQYDAKVASDIVKRVLG